MKIQGKLACMRAVRIRQEPAKPNHYSLMCGHEVKVNKQI